MISQMDNQNEESPKQFHSDFSIDHILNRAGNSRISSEETRTSVNYPLDPYSWLQCTRYCPPKIPRVQKREGPQKRQLGRHPRIPFTSHQLSILEEKFKTSPYLSSEEVITLSKKLDLADIRVKIWFQNRRARERRERSASNSTDSLVPSPGKSGVSEDMDRTTKSPIVKQEVESNSPPQSPKTLDVTHQPVQFCLSPVFYNNPFVANNFVPMSTSYSNILHTNELEHR